MSKTISVTKTQTVKTTIVNGTPTETINTVYSAYSSRTDKWLFSDMSEYEAQELFVQLEGMLPSPRAAT